jgi:hypothetical protein
VKKKHRWEKPRKARSSSSATAEDEPASTVDPAAVAEERAFPLEGEPESAPRVASASRADQLRGLFQIEDLVVFAWVSLLDLLSERFFPGLMQELGRGHAPLWLWLAVGLPFAVVFLTRGPDDTDQNQATSRRCVISIVPLLAIRDYATGGSSWSVWLGLWFLVTLVALQPFNHIDKMRRTPLGLRRLLVAPALLAGNAIFTAHAAAWLWSGADLQNVPAGYRGIAPVMMAAFLFLYTVIGPRVMAGGPWNAVVWLLRFGLYVAALKLGGRLDIVL